MSSQLHKFNFDFFLPPDLTGIQAARLDKAGSLLRWGNQIMAAGEGSSSSGGKGFCSVQNSVRVKGSSVAPRENENRRRPKEKEDAQELSLLPWAGPPICRVKTRSRHPLILG